jgi:hypothetical protein
MSYHQVAVILRPKDFAEFLIVSWGRIEGNLDVMLVGEFGLLSFAPPEDSEHQESVESQLGQVLRQTKQKEAQQVALLLDLPFNRKMDFLKKVEAINEKEYTALRQFQRDRNHCFHGGIWGSPLVKLSMEEKKLILNHAEKAIDASSSSIMRLLQRLKLQEDVAQ